MESSGGGGWRRSDVASALFRLDLCHSDISSSPKPRLHDGSPAEEEDEELPNESNVVSVELRGTIGLCILAAQ